MNTHEIFKYDEPKLDLDIAPGFEEEMIPKEEDTSNILDLVLKNSNDANDEFDQVDGITTKRHKSIEDEEGYTTAEEDKPKPPSPMEEQEHFSDQS